MKCKRPFDAEIERMARQLFAVRRNKVRRVKELLSRRSYGVESPKLARSLFVAR